MVRLVPAGLGRRGRADAGGDPPLSIERILALVAAGIAVLVGIAAAARSLREPVAAETVRDRLLVATHEAAKAGFWFALAVVFAGVGLLGDPYSYRWFVMLPIGMAAIRLATAALLWRT